MVLAEDLGGDVGDALASPRQYGGPFFLYGIHGDELSPEPRQFGLFYLCLCCFFAGSADLKRGDIWLFLCWGWGFFLCFGCFWGGGCDASTLLVAVSPFADGLDIIAVWAFGGKGAVLHPLGHGLALYPELFGDGCLCFGV